MTPDLHTGKYAAYIWSAYGITALVFIAMIVSTLRHARDWRRKAQDGDRT